MQRPTHGWIVVNEFGGSRCLVARNSIEKHGDIARAVVAYTLKPHGTDTRNGKKVSAMFNVEEYNLRSEEFRVLQISFRYAEDSDGDPLGSDAQWQPATGGNENTLRFLQASMSE